MKINQLPPLPTPKFTEMIRGVPCITVTEHEHLMRAYALQARAQVQGEPFGYTHHYAAHDESGALIDTTWEADGCADPLPHPTFPAMWKWTHCTPFYTTQQPATGEPVLFIHPDTFAMNNAHVGAWKPGHELTGYIPLYTHPAPSVPDDVVRDAISTVREHYRGTDWGKAAESICDAIDAAMLAAKEGTNGEIN